MKIIDTSLSDLKLLEPQVHGDHRGFFMETFRESWFRENVADVRFVQDNHSMSQKGTLRGLHFQREQVQGKLVRVVTGEVFDVAVDMRRSSATYGQWAGFHLSAADKRQLWVPEGFAHGFLVTSDKADLVYKCTDYYHPASEVSMLWDDPDVGIEWPIGEMEIKLSEKDKNGQPFTDLRGFD